MRLIICLLWIAAGATFPTSIKAGGGKCGPSLRWELDGTGTLIISGEGRMNDYGPNSTPWRIDLVKYLEISDGISYIGKNAFAGSKITSVAVPASVMGIGEKAFFKCNELAAVELPFGVERIERMAFADCPTLGLINIPSTMRVIGDKAFANCMSLSKISLPSRLRSLGSGAFEGCTALMEITEMPDFVTTANCDRYGIDRTHVQAYLDRSAATAESVLASVETSIPSAHAQWFANAGTTSPGYGSSDIDRDIPTRPQSAANTYAIVISNENYGSMADVPYSINDGTSFATYCRLVLGVPESNIIFFRNATYGQMKGALAYLKDIDMAYSGDINVIFYYSGHGAPDEISKEAFLIPVDAYKPVKDVCLPTDELYRRLGELKAKSVKVFLDACFSGATRDNCMIAQARAVSVVPKKSILSGNTVVLSASTANQTSWQYNEQQHGLFTYFLLKKIKDTKGDVSMGELSEYLAEKVGQTSVTLNKKSQTPAATASSSVGRVWRSWLLR